MDNQDKEIVIKVKDIIEYLSKLNPDSEVVLNNNGWWDDLTVEQNLQNLFVSYGSCVFIQN